MSYETRVLALFEEANPVPDPESLEPELETATHLADLQRGSSEMTQMDTEKETGPKQRLHAGWIAAATLALVAGIVAIVSSQGAPESEPAVSDPPAVVATTSPGPVETVPGEEAEWVDTPELLSSTPLPGLYRTRHFTPEFRFEITPGWKPAETENPYLIGLTPSSDWDDSTDAGPDLAVYFVKPEAETVDDAADIISGTPETHAGEQEPTEIGGAEGVRFDFDTDSFRFGSMGRSDGSSPGVFFDGDMLYEIHVVDVAGEVVTVVVQAPPELFDDFKGRARVLFETIDWRDL